MTGAARPPPSQASVTSAARPRVVGVGPGPLLALALAAGWVGALGLAASRLGHYVGAGFSRVLLPGGVRALDQALPWGLAFAALWALLDRVLARRLPDPARRIPVVTAALVVPLALVLARHLHRHPPPPFSEAPPLLLLGLALAVLAFGALASLALRRARQRPCRGSLVVAGLLAVLWPGAHLALHLSQRPPAPPNVIVLLVDVLRADHLGCAGYPRDTTPNLDRLAADGILFTQAIAPSTFTKTSVASLFTGRHPHRHGVYRGDRRDTQDRITSDVLAPELVTLAEAMRGQGWLTAAWVQNAHLRDYMGFAQGYVDYYDQPGQIERIRRKLREWHERLGRVDPFFHYLHFIDLHGPNRPEPPFRGRFGHYSDEWASLPTEGYTVTMRKIRAGELTPDSAGIEQLRADYDAVLSHVDDQIGRLLGELRSAGLYDDSLIVLTGDHGDAFMEHGIVGHSWTPHDELVRVPLIVKLPGSRHAGRRVDGQLRLVDLAPTLIEFVGGRPPAGMDGASFLAVLEDPEAALPAAADRAVIEHGDTVAVRTPRWKYIRLRRGGSELYDLASDPGERHDVRERHPQEADALARIADAVIASREERQAEETTVDAATVEELRALGYVE